MALSQRGSVTDETIKCWFFKIATKLAVMVHACNPSTKEAKAGGSGVRGQPELDSETLSKKKKKCYQNNILIRRE
jgi:hypothetical protein